MFVKDNKISSIKAYIKDKLVDQFSSNEIRYIINALLEKRLNLSSSELLLANEATLSESDLLYFRDSVKRLLNNEPIQYIVNNAYFIDLKLFVDSRVLIPRPETEELVEWIASDFNHEISVLDLCTGSGCIALGLKSLKPYYSVSAIEYSAEALDVANENALLTNLDVKIQKEDALNLSAEILSQKRDVWVSNPPYIPFEDKSQMSENVLKFEPSIALFVENDDPLIFYRRIAEQAREGLASGGFLYFEIHERLGQDVIHLLKQIGFVNIKLRKDLQCKDRMVKAQNP